jgi:hypothetical protein
LKSSGYTLLDGISGEEWWYSVGYSDQITKDGTFGNPGIYPLPATLSELFICYSFSQQCSPTDCGELYRQLTN